MICIDTSLLVPLFIEEVHSPLAKSWLSEQREPLVLSRLNLLEFRNAIALRQHHKSLTQQEAEIIHRQFDKIHRMGMFSIQQADDAVWLEAEGIARLKSSEIGSRSLDVWQVAFALINGANAFGSFDEKQRKLAAAVGLKVNLL
ncbi:MAG: type II toxin-antitoxin system VapC family toxin [Akkermansiaceae bacterium]|nr:type II toxin-antitoxin system VapC family toxin [Akkermansiaceae bacterium]